MVKAKKNERVRERKPLIQIHSAGDEEQAADDTDNVDDDGEVREYDYNGYNDDDGSDDVHNDDNDDDDVADDDIDAVPVTPRSVGSDRVRGAPRFAPTHAFFLLFVLIIIVFFFILIIIILLLLFINQIYISNVDFAPTHAFFCFLFRLSIFFYFLCFKSYILIMNFALKHIFFLPSFQLENLEFVHEPVFVPDH